MYQQREQILQSIKDIEGKLSQKLPKKASAEFCELCYDLGKRISQEIALQTGSLTSKEDLFPWDSRVDHINHALSLMKNKGGKPLVVPVTTFEVQKTPYAEGKGISEVNIAAPLRKMVEKKKKMLGFQFDSSQFTEDISQSKQALKEFFEVCVDEIIEDKLNKEIFQGGTLLMIKHLSLGI